MEISSIALQSAPVGRLRQKSDSPAAAQPTEESTQAHPPRFDEYVKNDKEASSTGIYSVEQDENGKPSILFDNPEKPAEATPGPVKQSPEDEEAEDAACTANTDKVDAEISKLKEQQKSIQQQLQQAESPEKKEELQRQLSNIETELQAKDNDAYRKQNTVFTNA